MNAAEALAEGTARLGAAGVESPGVDAEWLLAHVLDCPRPELLLQRNVQLTPEQADQWAELLAGRQARIPLQHLLGTANFCGLELAVNEHVLIPRPETELLAEAAWKMAGAMDAPRVVDIGTGSGCLAIAIAANTPKAEVHALDISPEALTLARANAERHKTLITFHEGNACESLPGAPWQIIVSNPPYIPSADLAELQPEVRNHDPALALDGGADGLSIYRAIIPHALAALAVDGRLLLEVGDGQAPAVREIIAQHGGCVQEIVSDLNNIERIVIASRDES